MRNHKRKYSFSATAMLLLYLLYGMVVPFMHHHGPDGRAAFATVKQVKLYPEIIREMDTTHHQAHMTAACHICDDYISNYLNNHADIRLPKPILLTILYVHPPVDNNERLVLTASNKGPPTA
ncbi:MAG: hypothetical protein JO154_25630 [Chitinophaga sp.]|uniref:hypothetical protein n=1 Tax=Chitinophaga sp. TaxID=1869181 RepID=UPI0025C4621C|nr:hypothetical protein [Chitinophaga sp.]MBV8256002.1 hypothetical protein [Chitinophaga sp.]